MGVNKRVISHHVEMGPSFVPESRLGEASPHWEWGRNSQPKLLINLCTSQWGLPLKALDLPLRSVNDKNALWLT